MPVTASSTTTARRPPRPRPLARARATGRRPRSPIARPDHRPVRDVDLRPVRDLAIVVDVSWYWANTLRVQRAADAAALAGVVWLPGNPTTGLHDRRRRGHQERLHRRAAGRPSRRSRTRNNRRLRVTIIGPRRHVLHEVFGITSIPATRTRQGRVRPAGPDGQPGELLRRVRPHPWPDLHVERDHVQQTMPSATPA